MPRNDQTGPYGEGPMTGRRMGACVGNQKQESFFNLGFGRGFRGKRMRFSSSHNQLDSLQKNQNSQKSNKELLESEIINLKKRLEFLEKELNSFS